ncbi:hypothetical protein Egran_05391 [Elaphomyces granulatus]|uniref:E3 ubiquitin ligase complex SCF subunit sconC n=1 Tax=Elaphomyces granulatus TaxID=519963 RepID=A0A232LRT8_9EURO|nr:hypothetical protein Egran_05391 [Elaphomyces granulatus]
MASEITFTSADGVNITVDRDIADCSLLIRDMLTDLPGHVNEPILLAGVKDKYILEKVVEWCTYHRSDTRSNETTDNDQDLRPNADDEDKDRRETTDDAQETTDNDVQETTHGDDMEDSDVYGDENDDDDESDDDDKSDDDDEITDHDHKTTDHETTSTCMSEWDEKFITALDQETLLEVVLAANFLDIKGLLDIGCMAIGNMIKGKSVEELRAQFDIVNDFTPEEEERIRRENAWADLK